MDCDSGELGYRVRGVLFPGAGQPDRALRIHRGAVEDDSRSHHADRVLPVLGPVPERRAEVELPRWIRSDDRRGVYCVQGVVSSLVRRGAT